MLNSIVYYYQTAIDSKFVHWQELLSPRSFWRSVVFFNLFWIQFVLFFKFYRIIIEMLLIDKNFHLLCSFTIIRGCGYGVRPGWLDLTKALHLTHFYPPFQHLLSERLTALGIMGDPRVPPLCRANVGTVGMNGLIVCKLTAISADTYTLCFPTKAKSTPKRNELYA